MSRKAKILRKTKETTIAAEVNLDGKGDYKIKWDANGQKGEDLPSGMYFYQLKTESFVKNKRMILLK